MAPSKSSLPKISVGHEEWVSFPELGLPAVLAKVDTGAKTSSLHAFAYEEVEEDGQRMIRFGVQPVVERPDLQIWCTAPLVAYREIISSNGIAEMRPIVRTTLRVGDHQWEIELSLTDRESMNYRKLLGRTAMEGRIVVDPIAVRINGDLDVSAYDELASAVPEHRLRFAILSKEPKNYSNRLLIKAIKAHGIEVEVLDPTRCHVDINEGKAEIFYKGNILEPFDAIVPRFGWSTTNYGLSIVRQFELNGAFCLNNAAAIGASRDKVLAVQLLAKAGAAMPQTAFAHTSIDMKKSFDRLKELPFLLRFLDGAQSRGTVIGETLQAARGALSSFRQLRSSVLVRGEAEGGGRNRVRCLVLGNKIIGAFRYDGELISEETPDYSKVKITKKERILVLKAAKVLGLRFAGVDLVRSKNGTLVLDVVPSPGLEAFNAVAKIDVADEIVEYVVRYSRLPAGVAKRKRG
ncbi:RimK family alpha-L-glutamate ligase [Maritalea porphyrae]|uniref:Alpha-L-glutamate ligase n=1 Tax=Maritalea porphyrae TaxID=880732 RepID=A0ABQ5ULX9_9HYPH|nr:RimK family alpha-L-glutamate ligase [Maritalea porphyrae]GLQ16122.1 alpha-L-glutamate ligase [Maritalea porphyrae]